MEEIKPCPFCGGTPVLITPDSGFQKLHRDSRNGYCYYCEDCETLCGFDSDYGGVYKTAEEAAIAWNKRAKPTKMYLVYYSRIRPFFGSYDEDLLFVTENKEKADAYVEKFNAILKKWRDYYRDLLNRHPYRTDRTTSIPEWIMLRSFKLGKIHQCFYKELEVR